MDSWVTSNVDIIVVTTVGYLIGSVPLANLLARRRSGVDLRDVGDRNPGFWNARDTLGRMAAVPVFVGDIAKGVIGAGIGALIAHPTAWAMAYIGGGAAMVGHAFPVFAEFRGGRSILTFVGTMLVCAPQSAVISIAIVFAVFMLLRSFMWAARAGMLMFPFVQLVTDGPYRTAATGALMTFIGLRFAMAAVQNRQRVVGGSAPADQP